MQPYVAFCQVQPYTTVRQHIRHVTPKGPYPKLQGQSWARLVNCVLHPGRHRQVLLLLDLTAITTVTMLPSLAQALL